MRCLSRALGCMLLSLLVMLAPVSIWTYAVWESTIANVDGYTDSFDEAAYEDMTIFVIPGVAQIHSETLRVDGYETKARAIGIFAQVIIATDRADWQRYIDGLIQPEWVRELLSSNLRRMVEFADFETTTLTVEADLNPVYQAISGETGATLQQNVFESFRELDPCSINQLENIDSILDGSSTNALPACRPNDEQLAQLRETFTEGRLALANDIKQLPDFQFNLRERPTTEAELQEFDEDMHDVRRVMYLIDETLAVILMFPVMLLSLIVVITVRSAKGFFLWTSLALLGTSTFTLAPLVPWIYGLLFENPSGNAITGTNDPGVELAFEMQRQLLGALSGQILIWVSVMAFVGVGFLLLAALLRGPSANPKQPVYYVMPGQTGSYPTPTGMGSTPTNPPMTYTAPPQTSNQPPLPGASGANPTRGSSAVDLHKDSLDKPGLPEDRTFIPPGDNSD